MSPKERFMLLVTTYLTAFVSAKNAEGVYYSTMQLKHALDLAREQWDHQTVKESLEEHAYQFALWAAGEIKKPSWVRQ